MFGLITPLLHWSFWFSARSIPFTAWFQTLLLIVLSLAFIGGVIAAWLGVSPTAGKRLGHPLENDVRRVLRQRAGCAITMSIVGWIFFFFTWQEIPYFSARIFWVGVFVGVVVWVYAILREARIVIPRERAEQAKREAYEKWLPKPKKN